VTVVRPEDLGSASDAARWLESAADPEAAERLVEEALFIINRALHAQGVSAHDAYTHEVSRAQAVATRIGYGEGEEVAEGLWSEARELLPGRPRRGRADSLQPQERVAAVLGGRARVAACETLVLRARLDLDQRRPREAALQLRAGLEALLAELRGGATARQAEDLAALEARRSGVERAARSALQDELDADGEAAVRESLEIAERVLRRRSAHAE
jgi:hypothetical protein